LLATAIRAARIEADNQDVEMSDETLLGLWNQVKADYPDEYAETKDDAYSIFAPLNDGAVSKAITAQFLAGMITGELPPVKGDADLREKIKGIIENDARLKYIKEAIEHVSS
jgi:putative ATP-dependent endonuclease of OLD family